MSSRLTVAEERPARDAVFEQECADLFSSFLHVLGVPYSVGAIYGLLFASPAPLSFTNIVEMLKMSKGSVSHGLTFLRQSGAVRVVRIDGERREYFTPELGLRSLASGLISGRVQPLAKQAEEAVARMRKQASKSASAQRKFQLERIEQMETWRRQLGRLLPLVQGILRIPHP